MPKPQSRSPATPRPVRRPWVSLGLAIAMLAAFATQQLSASGGDERAAAEAGLAEAVAYFEENPYLRPDARFVAFYGDARIEDARAAYEDDRLARGLPWVSNQIKLPAQNKLDTLVRSAFAQIDRLPGRRYGVTDRSTPPRNLFAHFFVEERVATLVLAIVLLFVAGAPLETAWGSLAFGLFCFTSVLVSAAGSIFVHGASDPAWAGSSGLAAALLGAYSVRSLRGDLLIAPWLLVPIWFVGEFVVGRAVAPRDLGSTLVAAHAVAMFFGVGIATLLRVSGGERSPLVSSEEESVELLSNPVLDQAMRARDSGNPQEAFDLLQAEVAAAASDRSGARGGMQRDLALAFWDVAGGLGQWEAATSSVISVIREDLQERRGGDAVILWRDLIERLPSLDPPAPLAVRMGEALLDEGHPKDAVATLQRVVDRAGGLSSVLALRVVRIARDLDSDLTGRAARLALADPQLDIAQRAELEVLAHVASPDGEPVQPPVADDPEPSAANAAPEPGGVFDDLDPHAFAAGALRAELASGASSPDAEDLARWNEIGVVEDLSNELDDAPCLQISTDARTSAPHEKRSEDVTDVMDAPLEGEHEEETWHLRTHRVLEAVPLALDSDALTLEILGHGKSKISLGRVDALAVGAVEGLASRTVIVVDVVLNWMGAADEPLRVFRLRSDHFDPRSLAPDHESALESLRAFLARFRAATDLTPLPDASSADGATFARFPDLASYERAVLLVDA